MNEISGKITRTLCNVYPTDCLVHAHEDYSQVAMNLDENNGVIVLDFGTDFTEPGKPSGATVAFNEGDLRMFIAMLKAGMKELRSVAQTG